MKSYSLFQESKRWIMDNGQQIMLKLSPKGILVLLLFIIQHSSFIITEAQTLSPNARVSLITVSAGQELYSIYGHSALWIKDDANQIDVVYNYGAFDFNTPNFYPKFLRGQLPYQLVADEFWRDLSHWQAENRMAYAQELNLTNAEKQMLFHRLNVNAMPQNCLYKYRFFFDNCSTRLRDIVQKVGGKNLHFSENLNAHKSYREWLDGYTRPSMPWVDFGMDLALGKPADSVATASGAMFLPDNLMMAFDSAKIVRDGSTQPLVLSKTELSTVTPIPTPQKPNEPIYYAWVALALGLVYTLWQYRNKKRGVAFDVILFGVAGLAGWLLVFLWFGTDHGVMEQNFNLVWAFPLLFPLSFFVRKNKTVWLTYGIALVGLLLAWRFLPQALNPAFLPIVILLATRAFFNCTQTHS